MNKTYLKYISGGVEDAQSIPELFNNNNIPFNNIDTVNWAEYPYKPNVTFRIAYTDTAILIHYVVKENHIRGKYVNDNEAVWTDSCCEFFCSPANDGIYYNFECNCIGTLLIGAGEGRGNREHAIKEVTKTVKRWSSLGNNAYDSKGEEGAWEVALIIPFTALWKHDLTLKKGMILKANFYKCGDELETPHFLSWNPIDVENPDFHRPEFFGELIFEQL